jgi:protein-tyrosine-phosphatase
MDWRIESAGAWAIEGAEMLPKVNLALKHLELELYEHRSRGVTREMLQSFNLILAMEKGQQETLRVELPTLYNRIYRLSEMIGQH